MLPSGRRPCACAARTAARDGGRTVAASISRDAEEGQVFPTTKLAVALALGLLAPAVPRARAAVAPAPVAIGDYDAVPRRADGHVDAPALAARLDSLGARTYLWLVWTHASDWDDLTAFLPLAARSGIRVIVDLVPPSECPPHTANYSEPWRTDYVRWAEAIATRSLAFPALAAWTIDDFTRNAATFTPDYVRRMRSRARAIAPALEFLPLAYFPHLRDPFVADYGGAIDGVIAAFPADAGDIRMARSLLGGALRPAPLELRFPWRARTRDGARVAASARFRVTGGAPAITFTERDDYTGPTTGHHRKRVLAGRTVLWDEDVAGDSAGPRTITLPLPRRARGDDSLTLTFELREDRGVTNFGVRWWIEDLRGSGLAPDPATLAPGAWTADADAPGATNAGRPAPAGATPRAPALLVMTTANATRDARRYGAPASPARVLARLDMCLDAVRAGECDGVILDALGGRAAGALFDSVRARTGALTQK